MYRLLHRRDALRRPLEAAHAEGRVVVESELADQGLRYDLTVPLARVAARYGSQLPTPFKRYQIAPVWRADRPGKGRYREFYQCDVDTIGSDSLTADAATLVAVTDALEALGLTGFRVQLNSRKALRGLVEAYGIDVARESDALVALDKLDKIGLAGVSAELSQRGIASDAIGALEADLSADDPAAAVRDRLQRSETGIAGLSEVDRLLALVADAVPVTYAPVLARGLSYYTGPVFEVVHEGLDATIAAGGRYDGLIGMFQSGDVPATGGSLGLERILLLLEAAEEADLAPAGPEVLVTIMDDDGAADAVALAGRIRSAGHRVEPYSGGGRLKLAKQLKYADRRGVRVAVIRGAEERAAATVTCKALASGEQRTVPLAELESTLAAWLEA